MNSKNNKKDLFDPDFEVTYEDDPVFHYAEEPQANREFQNIDLKSQPKPPRSRQKKQKIQLPLQGDETILMNPISNGSVSSHPNQKPPQWEEEPDRRKNSVRSKRPESDSYDYEDSRPRRKNSASSRRKADLLSPLKSTAKYGGKTIYKTASILIRFASLLLIASTAAFLAYNFWKGCAPYGDPLTAVEEKNYCLAAYAAVAGFFLLYECISFLWAMTRVRVRDGRKTYKEDTGRGLFSFIFICVCSYASFWVNRIIPQSPDVLRGIHGALEVFGSMHNALLGLCLAGVISCLVRKYAK